MERISFLTEDEVKTMIPPIRLAKKIIHLLPLLKVVYFRAYRYVFYATDRISLKIKYHQLQKV